MRQKGFVNIIILLIVFVVGTVFLLNFKKYSKTNQKSENIKADTPVTDSEYLLKEGNYTNSKLGIKFKYNPSIFKSTFEPTGNKIYLSTKENLSIYDFGPPKKDAAEVVIKFTNNNEYPQGTFQSPLNEKARLLNYEIGEKYTETAPGYLYKSTVVSKKQIQGNDLVIIKTVGFDTETEKTPIERDYSLLAILYTNKYVLSIGMRSASINFLNENESAFYDLIDSIELF